MLLASYQPLVEDIGRRAKSGAFAALVETLGFVPYFCFPAERLEDMLVHSFFAAPNCPERIVIFETENFQKLDVVQWNRILRLEDIGEPFDVSLALLEAEAPFCEYLVPAFENVRVDLPLHEALYTSFRIDYADELTRNAAVGWFAMAQGRAVQMYEAADLQADTTEGLEVLMGRALKNSFEVFVLPVLYIFMVSGRWEDLGTMLNPDWIFKNKAPMEMLTRIYNPRESMGFKTYGYFEKAFRSFQANMLDGEKKPSRNGRCPCGSGKKFKRCCGR